MKYFFDRNLVEKFAFHLWGNFLALRVKHIKVVLNPGEGVCADPVSRDSILEVKGPGPPSGVSERQLNPDRGAEKT
jgi:hypothetical protein